MPELICPRCEKSLNSEHNRKACDDKQARGMSRRFFFQVAFGGLAAAVGAKISPNVWRVKAQGVINNAVSLDEINAVTLKHITPRVPDAFFNKSPLLFRLSDADRRHYYSREWIVRGSWIIK